MIIEIRHISGRQFELRRGTASCGSAEITPPEAVKLPSYGDTNLAAELIWYMEDYMRRPFGKENEHAHAVEDALKSWGRKAFDALFVRECYTWYKEAKNAADGMRLRIVSDSPSVLSWPWEALCDKDDFITLNSSIERQTTDIEYQPQQPETAEDGLNILFVIARPKEGDNINYHFLSRDVVELISKDDRQINIDVLRPPTFENLRNALRSKRYHIVHFDGHGGYREDTEVTRDSFRGVEGKLCFEKTDGGIDPVGAETLGQLLSNCGVPMMVLNACQSAMVDDRAESPYASVAASLIRAGVRSVVAMGYSLFTGGAKAFVPAFYKELFKSGSAESAIMEGRVKMYRHRSKSYPLSDWIVPQLYQQAQQGERVLPDISGLPTVTRRSRLPKDARLGDTGFIGRGQAIQELERMMLRDKAAMLIYGFAGQGKTTLAQGFLWWLENTGGLDEKDEHPVLWMDFRSVHSAETVINEILRLAGGEMPVSMDEKIELATGYLKSHKKIIVWDNFESASGKGDSTAPNLTDDDMNVLVELVKALRGGRSKIIITSRDEETQFSGFYCSRQKRPLEGLEGGELWSFCQTVAEGKNVKLDRDDVYLEKLLEKLDGNPLSIRAVLLRLDKVSTKQLLEDFDKAFAGDESDEATRRIRASFKVMCQGMEPEFEQIFQVLSMFEHYADIEWVINIIANLRNIETDTLEANDLIQGATRCFNLMAMVGFAQCENGTIYRLHPALRGCLAEAFPPDNDIRRMFVQCISAMEKIAHNVTQDRIAFAYYHESNCRRARAAAWELDMRDEYLDLTFDLSAFANDRSSLREHEELLLELEDKSKLWGDDFYENRAYSLLSGYYSIAGNDALSKDYAGKVAEMAGRKAELTAKDWHDIGDAASLSGNYDEAIEAYEKAAAIWEQEGDSRVLNEYGLLFSTAAEAGNKDAAEKYRARLEEYTEKAKDKRLKATAYGLLGNYAVAQGKASDSLGYYTKALKLYRDIGDRQMTAFTSINIGRLLIGKPQAAIPLFEEALFISSDMEDEPRKANALFCLGLAFAIDKSAPNQRAIDHLNEAMKLYKKLNSENDIARTQRLIDAINSGEFDKQKGGTGND